MPANTKHWATHHARHAASSIVHVIYMDPQNCGNGASQTRNAHFPSFASPNKPQITYGRLPSTLYRKRL